MTVGAGLFALAVVLGLVVSPVFFLLGLIGLVVVIAAWVGLARATTDEPETPQASSPASPGGQPGTGGDGAPADGEGSIPAPERPA